MAKSNNKKLNKKRIVIFILLLILIIYWGINYLKNNDFFNELNSNSIDSFPSLVYDKFTLFYLLKGRCPIKEETWFLE